MRPILALLIACVLTGCAGVQKRGHSYFDSYDSVRVDQMTGNNVSGAVLERTILCLNARRETRMVPAITNYSIVSVTNVTYSFLTNYTVTVVTNESRTLATNQLAAVMPQMSENSQAGGETNQVAISLSLAAPSTNQTVTIANNTTHSKAPNQTVANLNHQKVSSVQVTVTTNNLSITTADNQVVSAETNQVITIIPNQTITTVTNQTVLHGESLVREYYLFTEFTPPSDFNVNSGESLVLLIDGVRHGFTHTNAQTVYAPRKGFVSNFYKVSPDVLVSLANANEVRIRVKGNDGTIEREMSQSSRDNLKKFLLRYFSPDSPEQTETKLTTVSK